MKLSGEDLERFREALMVAFPSDAEELPLVVDNADIGINFKDYPGSYGLRVQTLLKAAAGKDTLTKLFQAAVKGAPENTDLAEIKKYVEAYTRVARRVVPRGDRANEGALEAVLFTKVGFQNVGEWLEKLERLRHRVCRIEPQPRDAGLGGYGTGFLVGPDVVLTNDHVASGDGGNPGFWDDPVRARKVLIRFDCEHGTDGRATDGKAFELHKDYKILNSPSGKFDFALLRLKDRASDDVVGNKPRGYIVPAAHEFNRDEPLLILQHPEGDPMKLALGAVTAPEEWAPDRIAYKVNTAPGSSGSPCMTQGLQVVALHRQGGSEQNSGVRMSSLVKFWQQEPQREKLLSARLDHLIPGEAPVPPPQIQTPGVKVGGEEAIPLKGPHKNAFVIQSLGKEDSIISTRADDMLRELIAPACEDTGFIADRADKYPDDAIREPIISALFTHPLVVADLGNLREVNANVMIEVGFRLSTGRPIVILADKPLPDIIPVHLSNTRILAVDPKAPKASQEELKSRIRKSCDPGQTRSWTSEHAWVDMQLALGDGGTSLYLSANEKAAHLFGVDSIDDLIGHSMNDSDERLYSFMDDGYKKEFLKEQNAIIGELIKSLNSESPQVNTVASLPLIFTKHPRPELNKAVHYPVIANYKFDKPNQSMVLRMVFLQIEEWCLPDYLTRSIAFWKIPDLFRHFRYEHDFFLCYDSADFRQAQMLKDVLAVLGFNVWSPTDPPSNQAEYKRLNPDRLVKGLAKSKIAAVLVGANDRGRWGQSKLDDALFRHCELHKPLILVLLPDHPDSPEESWLGERYRDVLPEPLYLPWPDHDDDIKSFPNNRGSFLFRIMTVLAKLLRLEDGARKASD